MINSLVLGQLNGVKHAVYTGLKYNIVCLFAYFIEYLGFKNWDPR